MQHFFTWASIPKNNWVAWLLLLAGVSATVSVTLAVKASVEREIWREFVSDSNEVASRIEGRLEAHKQVLLGGAALFDASRSVERNEWRDYAERLQIDRHFAGIQGLGFSLRVPRSRLDLHVAGIRKEGFPEYKVWPAGERETYSSIVYLEPFSGRNLRAFGFDMYSESVRHAAMDQACDTGSAALSGKVMLVQENGDDTQAGTLMYMPVYRHQMPVDTVEHRRAALLGWVYSPFRMNDLLQGVAQPRDLHRLHFRVYDGRETDFENLLYDSASSDRENDSAYQARPFEKQIVFNGHAWTLRFDMVEDEVFPIDYSLAWSVFAAGLAVSFLLYLLALSVLHTRRNAHLIATELMVELNRSVETEQVMNQQLRLQGSALDASANAVAILGTDTKIVWANAAFERIAGCDLRDAIGRRLNDLISFDESALGEQIGNAIRAGKVWHGEVVNHRNNGTDRYIEMTISPVLDTQGKISHFIVIQQDVTERKRAEYDLEQSQHRMELALSGGDLGLWDWDVSSGKVIFNQRWCEMLGYTLDEIEPNVSSWKKLVHPDDWTVINDPLFAHMRGETASYESEHRMRHKDGHWVWILDRGKVMERDAHNQPVRMLGTHLDISERKHSEQLRQMQAEAQRNALVREVHHRIKNNLQGMIGLLGLDAAQNPLAAMAIGKAIGKIKSIAVVFGLQGLRDENDIYLHEVISELCTVARNLTDADIHLQVEGNMAEGIRLGNDKAVAISLVVNELITNAIKHNAGGVISISLGLNADESVLSVMNHCADTSAGLDWEAGVGLGTGLNLVRLMLPPDGAGLSLQVEGGMMNAKLRLRSPVINLSNGT